MYQGNSAHPPRRDYTRAAGTRITGPREREQGMVAVPWREGMRRGRAKVSRATAVARTMVPAESGLHAARRFRLRRNSETPWSRLTSGSHWQCSRATRVRLVKGSTSRSSETQYRVPVPKGASWSGAPFDTRLKVGARPPTSRAPQQESQHAGLSKGFPRARGQRIAGRNHASEPAHALSGAECSVVIGERGPLTN